MTDWRTSAIKRLLHDLKEVITHPLKDVVARPLEDDLFVWHGNVRGGVDSMFTDVPVHFVLVFPDEFPHSPPKVGLYTRLPHPNIVNWIEREARTAFRLALWDCNPDENQWSSAYTVHSMLIQVQAFLIAEDMMWQDGMVSFLEALNHARNLGPLKEGGHSGANPWPTFATEEQISEAAERCKAAKIAVQRPQNRLIRSRPIWTPAQPAAKETKVWQAENREEGEVLEPAKIQEPETPSNAAQSKTTAVEYSWQVVEKGWKAKKAYAASKPQDPQLQGPTASSNPFSQLTKKNQALLDKLNKANPPPAVMKPATPLEGLTSPQTKTSKKNLARSRKRSAKQMEGGSVQSTPAATMASTSRPSTPSPPVSAPNTPGPQPLPDTTGAAWQEIPQKLRQVKLNKPEALNYGKIPHKELIQSVVKLVQQTEHQAAREDVADERDPKMGLGMGLFTDLSIDLINDILALLPRKDVGSLAMTCKGLNACANDGCVWKMLLDREFGNSQLTASRASDWKHAYMLQSSNIIGSLQCFHSKASFEDEVLGMPLFFTINPKKRCVDHIMVGIELLSVSAFKQGVQRSATKADLGDSPILEVCPVYLSDGHFQRALPQLQRVLKVLNPAVVMVNPSHWLDTCAKMLNTSVLLLIDQGIAASQKAIHVYCQMHRLLLALAEHYNLWDHAVQRLEAFLRFPSKRNKDTCPNLGWLITMLAVSPKHTWSDISIAVLLEALDRSVIWACKEDKELVLSYKKPVTAGGEDEKLLEGVFKATRVSRGLIAFHAAFMRHVARPCKIPLEKVIDQADTLFGFASNSQILRIQNVVKRCQDITSWADYLGLIGANPHPGKQTFEAFMTRQLRQTWENSLRKGYHTKITDFSRIQASGVSKILLKGQAYSAPPNLKFLHVNNSWRSENPCCFLDLSLLLYAFNGNHVCTVDYATQESHGTACIGAVRHSGDLMGDASIGYGMYQAADIDLDRLGLHVAEIWMTGSAWADASLSDIRQPKMVLIDPNSGTELCEYQLEEYSRDLLKQKKGVVMCRIFRESEHGSWKVEAIGKVLDSGDASNYRPILRYISAEKV